MLMFVEILLTVKLRMHDATRCITGCTSVYTMQPVVQPVVQRVIQPVVQKLLNIHYLQQVTFYIIRPQPPF